MSKHTPGPWTVRHLDIVAGERTNLGWRTVATIPKGPIGVGIIDGDEAAANAALISAAPDLLAACERAAACIAAADGRGESHPVVVVLRAAITKAEGR